MSVKTSVAHGAIYAQMAVHSSNRATAQAIESITRVSRPGHCSKCARFLESRLMTVYGLLLFSGKFGLSEFERPLRSEKI
jgi:hypothetical protein